MMLMTWTSLQDFLLDLAQVQIAIMFGGGYSDRSSSVDSAFVCFFVVSAMHLMQNRGVRQFVSDNIFSLIFVLLCSMFLSGTDQLCHRRSCEKFSR